MMVIRSLCFNELLLLWGNASKFGLWHLRKQHTDVALTRPFLNQCHKLRIYPEQRRALA